MFKPLVCVATLSVFLTATPSIADVWDTAAGSSDDTINSNNSLVHGAIQVHDMGARPGPVADEDWYWVFVPRYASFEVLIDGQTGDLSLAPAGLERWSVTAVFVEDGTENEGDPLSLRLSWRNLTSTSVFSAIRVWTPLCATACTASDQYTIRARETTVSVPRFNNSGSQVTVLLVQNASGGSISGDIHFWSSAGALLHTQTFTNQGSRTLSVLALQSIPALTGQSGSITIAHSGPYGGLSVKSVALEPATGFSFDTPGVYKGF